MRQLSCAFITSIINNSALMAKLSLNIIFHIHNCRGLGSYLIHRAKGLVPQRCYQYRGSSSTSPIMPKRGKVAIWGLVQTSQTQNYYSENNATPQISQSEHNVSPMRHRHRPSTFHSDGQGSPLGLSVRSDSSDTQSSQNSL